MIRRPLFKQQNPSFATIMRAYRRLAPDERAKVKEVCERYEPDSYNQKRLIFKEAIEVVIAAVRCTAHSSCAAMSRDERLAEV